MEKTEMKIVQDRIEDLRNKAIQWITRFGNVGDEVVIMTAIDLEKEKIQRVKLR